MADRDTKSRADSVHEGHRPLAQTGRPLGPRALKTRQKLLDATAHLLRDRSILDMAVVDIARNAETSAATFYHYFRDVEEAALQLAQQAAAQMPPVVDLIEAGPWRGEAGAETARRLADDFVEHWEAHHEVLLIRNLSADKGDPRFQEARRAALEPILAALADRIAAESGTRNGAHEPLHPFAAASALVSMLEKLSAHTRLLSDRGVSRDELIQTTASILQLVVTGGETH